MEFLPAVIEDLIYDYKSQMEYTEKFNLCLNEIKKIRHKILEYDNNHTLSQIILPYNKKSYQIKNHYNTYELCDNIFFTTQYRNGTIKQRLFDKDGISGIWRPRSI